MYRRHSHNWFFALERLSVTRDIFVSILEMGENDNDDDADADCVVAELNSSVHQLLNKSK